MQLVVHEDGSGPRTAVLIHGLMSDHRAWHRVSARLQERGFRVVTVDLAGHGRSPRARRYSPRAWADDVVESLAPVLTDAPDLLMGHSLGGLVASIAAERMSDAGVAPAAVAYVDPAFGFPGGVRGAVIKLLFAVAPRPRRASLQRWNPKWDAEDLEIELATLAEWDKRTILGMADSRPLQPPTRLVAPSLVILAERSWLVSDELAGRLRDLGMRVETLPGSGHTVFRDAHRDFMTLVERWLETAAAARQPS